MSLFFKRLCFRNKSNNSLTPDYLFRLFREAHREYRECVPTSKMSMRVFALQFIAKHKHGDDTSVTGRNHHNEALCLVRILLTERHDLVALFFETPELDDRDIERMMKFVYTESRIGTDGEMTVRNPLSCTLGDKDWPVIMECVNKTRLFKRDVSEDEIKDLLLGTLKEPLTANNLQGICCLFDALSVAMFITGQWQTPLARSESIKSGKSDKFVTITNLSTTLSRLRAWTPQPYQADIKLLMGHLADKNGDKTAMT